VTAVVILGGSAGPAGAIAAYADGSVDARPLVAAWSAWPRPLMSWLGADRPMPGPKIHIDPRL
jgi:hypothetical protein